MKSRTRHALALSAATATALGVFAAPATAVISPTRDALQLARTISDRPATVTGASFVTIPPAGNPTAISTTRLGGFPTSSNAYVIMSTGNANFASNRNTSPATGVELNGPVYRGARDVTTLKIDLNVPSNARCLSVRFRYYSEEFNEFIGSTFNDAFIAELDKNTWDAGTASSPTITAPDNFAFDARGREISVNSTGPTSVSSARSTDTTYDAATRRLRASVPVTPGAHSLYLTIFDQGDRIYDSAVAIDRLTLSNLQPCTSGAAVDTPGNPPGTIKLASGRFSIPASKLFNPFRMLVQSPAYRPNPIRRNTRRATLRVRVRDGRGFVIRGARVRARSFPRGLLRAIPTRRTRTNGIVTFTLRPTVKFRQMRNGRAYVLVEATKVGGRPGQGVSGYRLITIKSRG